MSLRDEILSKANTTHVLPSNSIEMIQKLQDPNVDLEEIASRIELDPGLTSVVLRLANSAYFGSPQSVGSLRRAIGRLGTNNVFRLVIASTVAPSLGKSVGGYDLSPGDLLDHSIAVAFAAEHLAELLGTPTPENTFTSGLLHDVGKLVLGSFVEVDGVAIERRAYDSKVSFEHAEREILGTDHAEVGAALLGAWNFPDDIINAVRWHHAPREGSAPTVLGDLVHVADEVCVMAGIGVGSDGCNYRPDESAVRRLNLNTQTTELAMSRVVDGVAELRELMSTRSRGETHVVQHTDR